MRKTIFKKLEAQGLIANYNRLRKNLPPKLPDRTYIWDETFREGIKAPTVYLTYVEQVRLAKLMDEAGIEVINVGFPALSEDEKRAVKRIVNESFTHTKLVASAEPTKNSIDACLDCGIKEIVIESPINGLNLQYKLKITKEQGLQRIVDSIDYAKKHGVTVNFTLMDGTRTPLEDIIQVFEAAANAGAVRLVIADSVGFIRPLSMRYLISHIRDGLSEAVKKKAPLGIHCHNDFGLASANTLAAMEEGVSFLHTCIAGFGERAGIAPFEEVVTAAELLYNIDTGVDLGKIYRIAQSAEKAFAMPIQFHKPIIGENIFTHEVEEEVEEMMSQPLVYEPFPPEIVGRETMIFIGRNTGQTLIQKLLEKAGIRASPRQMDELFRRIKGPQESLDKGEAQMTYYQVKKLMKDLLKGYTMDEFWRLVEQVTRQRPKLTKPTKKSETADKLIP
ncbi:MAG: LeuA family protein [Ignavibacteria bacterium]|jgi:isopropylmalate/homocitrate/citramalate synthase